MHHGEAFILGAFLKWLQQEGFVYNGSPLEGIELEGTTLFLLTESKEKIPVTIEEQEEKSNSSQLIDLITKNSQKEEVF